MDWILATEGDRLFQCGIVLCCGLCGLDIGHRRRQTIPMWSSSLLFFVAVRSNLTAVECVDFVTDCEIELVKISLKGRQELFVGSFYMPKRNMTDLNNLRQSLELLNKSKPKHLVLCGDFNCPDIDWD